MKQVCNQCHKDYDVEEFNPCEIRSIMEEQHLCFKCAFWKWQKRLDVEVRPKEGGNTYHHSEILQNCSPSKYSNSLLPNIGT